jgi:hypothetical protein
LPKLGEADFCTEGEKIVSAWNIEKERNKQKNPLSSPGGHDWAKKKNRQRVLLSQPGLLVYKTSK